MSRTLGTLSELVSVGPATVKDLEILGISDVVTLAKQDADELHSRLSRLTGIRQDICVLDVFTAAIAQARDPNLPAEQKRWYYWSRLRKGTGP
jgi:nucleotidyltransferase/DNA polymerase involved in DNA repair